MSRLPAPSLASGLWVAAGSALGGSARFLLTPLIGVQLPGFPWQLLLVNLGGCLLIGLAAALLSQPRLRFFLLAGVCGGFTSFSAFTLDTLLLAQTQLAAALLYVIATLAGGIAAAAIGNACGARWRR